MKTPDELVARIKAAAAMGIPTKVIARHAKVSCETVKSYAGERRRAEVTPDPTFLEQLQALFRVTA